MDRKTLYALSAWVGTGLLARWGIKHTGGMVTLGLTALTALAFLVSLRLLLDLLAQRYHRTLRLPWLSRLTVALTAMLFSLILFEGFLAGMSRLQATRATDAGLTLPDNWKERPAKVEGAAFAWYWHDILHVFNAERLRRIGELPPRQPDTYRILVLGDSLTYGYGVEAEQIYCRVLERELNATHRVEVLNLGRCGDQSEDICCTLKKYLPTLKPDLVVYGMCLNDFLPSGCGTYSNNMAWSISFPYQKHYTDNTRLGGFLARQYNSLLMSLGIRVDFLRDILRDFKGCQERFARDVAEMNTVVTAAQLPPITTMVLHAHLNNSKSLPIIAIAERLMYQVGMNVVPSQHYLERHAGQLMTVSRWEGHPNAEAHAMYAHELLPHILKAPGLERYRR